MTCQRELRSPQPLGMTLPNNEKILFLDMALTHWPYWLDLTSWHGGREGRRENACRMLAMLELLYDCPGGFGILVYFTLTWLLNRS